MITARLQPSSYSKLVSTLSRIHNATQKEFSEIIKQASVFALESAAKATKPGRTSLVSRLAKKYRVRPLVNYPETEGFAYSYTDKSGKQKIFTADKFIETRKRHDIKRVRKAIQVWSKKKGGFVFWPWNGKRDADNKKFKIPHYGAAKAGWLNGLGKLGNSSGNDAGDNRNLAIVSISPMQISMTNKVDYASITSPGSPARGIKAAESRMRHTYFPKVERKIKQVAT